MDALRVAFDAGVPVLGICLGAQLIAAALGAAIVRNPVKEIGWSTVRPTAAGSRDPLFKHLGKAEQIFQWHGDTFHLPEGAELLAETDACKNQAFRYAGNVYGLQFHLEVDQALIRRWLSTPAMHNEIAALDGAVKSEVVLEETNRYIGRSMRLSHDVFSTFISRFFGWRRRLALPSR